MQDELIKRVAELMSEQTKAYARLSTATDQLSAALVRGEPNLVESVTRAGDAELLKMRSRLLEITSELTKFAENRAMENETTKLSSDVRKNFEASAKKLIKTAKKFQRVSSKAANLALGGSSFASACVQKCGVPPLTYSPPVLKLAEGGLNK